MTSQTLRIRGLLLLLAAALMLASATVGAADAEADAAPLFINLITDDPHRAHMALSFGQKQLALGHPLTVFLNDRGVLIAAKQGAERFGLHQEIIAELLTAGAKVIVCPMCMQHYGVAEADLLDGLAVGNPKLTGGALFAPDTRTLTW
ncbi:DsrE family protein [uncultured Thiohalocapsa sp.]|uniref:DsrE family protein n=1 Tax=uncultured Thiohalocapsa sp. TaxID=768990 RepID=UPI0025D59F95|nr:DsrE family protein [uncultured Thiohalocapsa sp.]